MSFKVPRESSPPSTPGKSRSFLSNVSNTPAGVPPSSAHSFTPQGPPPSTVYGSSQPGSRIKLNFGDSLFSKSGGIGNDSIFMSSVASSDYQVPQGKKKWTKDFGVSQSSFGLTNGTRFGESTNFGASNGFGESQMSEYAEDVEEDEEMEAEASEAQDDMDMEGTNGQPTNRLSFLDSSLEKPLPSNRATSLGQRKPIYSNPDNAKRPKLDETWANRSPLGKHKLSPKKGSAMPSIARDLASRSRIATVNEPSDVIIATEDEICRMYDDARQIEYSDVDFAATLSDVSKKLGSIWQANADKSLPRPYGAGANIGPGENAPNLVKASFLGSLILQLHHPPTVTSTGDLSKPKVRASPYSLVLANPSTDTFTPTPKVVLDWINANHVPQPTDILSLKEVEPNATASSNFWELVITAVLRGRLSEVAEILRMADFNYARSALEDGLPQAGYRGVQLQNIQRCVNKARQVLESCPGLQNDDWDVKGVEWALYRKRVVAAVTDLEEFAEGEEPQVQEPPTETNRFQAVNFGLTSNTGRSKFSFTQSARMAESRVPWTIYQNLKALYRILLGDTEAITAHAQDWVEATIALTAWWDGEDDTEVLRQGDKEFRTSSASNDFRRSRNSKLQGPRAVDTNPGEAYLNRLSLAFSCVTDQTVEGSFRLNSLSSVEVGLASVFESNVEGVIQLLQTWSLCITSAVAEVAAVGGWLKTSTGVKPLSNLLSENDLMVLSYAEDTSAPTSRITKDDVLSAYATGLFERPAIENASGVKEGWEIALEALSRLDNAQKMQKSVSELLEKIPLDTADQMDKAVLLCTELGLSNEGRRVSERYGDLTASKSEDYGLALVCYARAHSRRKVKSVVDLLTSYSIFYSRAYPATADLDEQLRSLIREPKAALGAIASVDEEAARILQFYFSGYATLRRFYEIRDEAVGLKDGQQPRFKPLARRRAAAQALVAVIRSASDSIYGGLYDPDRDSAVQVDGLMALLGEALALIDQPTPVFSVEQQFTVLSAIEDLETVTPRVYAQCEECFRSALIEYHSSSGRAGAADGSGSNSLVIPPSPRALFKKSVSSLTGSSSFSVIGSDMIESARTRSGSGSGSTGSSAVLVPRPGESDKKGPSEKGWDWRAGLPEDAKGEDVLRILRLGLAKGLSFGALGSV